jgi:hypothetical protein
MNENKSGEFVNVLLFAFIFGGLSVGVQILMFLGLRSLCPDTPVVCSIAPYSHLIMLGTTTLLSIFALKWLGVASAKPLALIVGVILFISPITFTLSPLQLLPIVILIVRYPLLYGATYWFLGFKKIDPTTKMIVGVIAIGLASYGAQALSDNNLSTGNDSIQSEVKKIDNFDFDPYQPSYTPDGYRIYSFSSSYDDKPAPYVTIEYIYKNNDLGDPVPFTIYIFKSSSRFNPPKDCGPEYPSDILTYSFECKEIGKNLKNEAIYQHISRNSNVHISYIKTGSVIVSLKTTDPEFSTKESLKILGSLKQTTAQEIKDSYGQGQ